MELKSISKTTILVPSGNLAITKNQKNGQIFLLNMVESQPIVLEKTAADLWALFDGINTLGDVASNFELVTHEDTVEHIARFAHKLHADGYLVAAIDD